MVGMNVTVIVWIGWSKLERLLDGIILLSSVQMMMCLGFEDRRRRCCVCMRSSGQEWG